MENEATDTDRANGLDIADYIIAELKFPLSKTINANFHLLMEMMSEGQERSRAAKAEVIHFQSRFTHEL